MDVREHNRRVWDLNVEQKNRWTVPVSEEIVKNARKGQWEIVLTPTKPVPREWFPDLTDLEILCLASGGGQQGPILATAGAHVTVLDFSPRQLAQDRLVAERNSLDIKTVEGDMADLFMFPDRSFDLIIHPVSNCFVPDVKPVWKESYRVLKKGGLLLSGFVNPVVYLFDYELAIEKEVLQVKYKLPYADTVSLSAREKAEYLEEGWEFEFGHTLEDQIGGQIEAGFLIAGFYEDIHPEDENDLLSKYTPTFIATKALKP
ncbi:MAG: class I SAM-dependent methyltransferase [Anaerolineales bacterium]